MPTKFIADIVIVGGGAAGSVLANRLSQKFRVILIEAGQNNDQDEPITDSAEAMDLHEKYHNQYFWNTGETLPQAQVNNRTFDYTGGRLLGGSSSINGMQYVRGTDKFYHQWEAITKDPEFGPRNAHRVFKKLEKYAVHSSDDRTHGYDGPVKIRPAPLNPTIMAQKFVNGVIKATGFEEISDYNDPATPLGPFTQWQLYQNPDGSRVSGSIAYLDPIIESCDQDYWCGKDGHQLLVLTKTTVTSVKFKKTTATGINCISQGTSFKIKARKRIILSAGVLSPIILMRSGIGPAKDLREVNIPVIVNNPNVGQNLINHTLIFVTASANPNDVGLPPTDPNSLYVGGAFLPDYSKSSTGRGVQLIGMNPEPGIFSIIGIPVQPLSQGYLKLVSNDPLHVGVYDFQYLTHPEDLETLISIIRLISTIVNQIGDSAYQVIKPSPEILNNNTKLGDFIRDTLDQNHHWVGTCRMAPHISDGVVDNNGNVHGVKNLMVVDASIIPVKPDGNTSGPTFFLANVIADKLLRDL